MKKATLILLSVCFVFLAGCSKNPVLPAEGTSAPAPGQAPSSSSTQNTELIGEERAKEIALERAGISAEGVTFGYIELDWDDGIQCYEFDFYKDQTEYEIEIKADDGTVLSFDVDYRD